MRNARSKWVGLAVLATAQFMVMVDGAVVNVALPSIQRDLNFSSSSIQWVFSAYLLPFGGLLLLGGRIADIYGRRRLFMVGAGLLTASSLSAGVSGSAAQLIAARAAMGVGAAIITPAALSMLLVLFDEGSERDRALGIWGALIGVGAAVGVMGGGLITDGPGWRWIFFINIPFGLAALLLTPILLCESRTESARPEFDLAGGLTITASLVTIVYAVVKGPDVGWASAQTIGLLALGAALLVAFIVIELRTREPLLPMSIFRLGAVAGSNAVVLVFGGAVYATIFMLTIFMQRALGYSALQAGLAYLPLTLGLVVSSTVAARIVGRAGAKPVMLAGITVTAVALLVLSRASASSSFVGTLLPAFVLLATGMGLTLVPLSIAAFAGVGNHDFGVASGLFNTTQQIGGAVGVALLSTVAYAHLRHASTRNPAAVIGAADAAAFRAGLVLIVFSLAIAASVIRGHRLGKPSVTTDPASTKPEAAPLPAAAA